MSTLAAANILGERAPGLGRRATGRMADVHPPRGDAQDDARDESPDLGMAFLVSDAMLTVPKTQAADVALDEIRELFRDDHVRIALIVTPGGRLVTTLERGDLLAAASSDGRAAELGTLAGRTVLPSDSLAGVTAALLRRHRRRLAVVDEDGRLVGLLCLKRDGTGFCSDAGVLARASEQRALACGQNRSAA